MRVNLEYSAQKTNLQGPQVSGNASALAADICVLFSKFCFSVEKST